MNKEKQHFFLTALGKVDKSTEYSYQINDSVYSARLAPLALLQHLTKTKPPDKTLVLVTKGAQESTWPVFEKAASDFHLEKIDIPDGKNEDEIKQILETVAQKIPEGVAITLDVTQGFRHYPFILYALALYLRSLKEIEVRGAYYGMLEGFDRHDLEPPRPILNLQPLLELPEWFYAVRMFRETGSAGALARIMKSHAKSIHQDATMKNHDRALHELASSLEIPFEEMTCYYEAALPIEVGQKARTILPKLQDSFTRTLGKFIPLAEELTDTIRQSLEPFQSFHGNKQECLLDQAELERQAGMIDLYFERKQLPLAIGLLREWVVSWMLLRSHQAADRLKAADWLKRNARVNAERRLGLMQKLTQENCKINKIKQWGDFWNQVTKLRNALHHHGMQKEETPLPPKKLDKIQSFFNQLRQNKIEIPQVGGGKGRLLLTPLGQSPGVLYSALQHCHPQRCLVICSRQSQPYIQDAKNRTESEFEELPLVMENPFQFSKDVLQKFLEQSREWMMEADEVVANLTGGTTVMGILIQQLAEQAQRYNRPTRRFILIDPRTVEEQKNDPYQVSEFEWLDEPKGEADGDD